MQLDRQVRREARGAQGGDAVGAIGGRGCSKGGRGLLTGGCRPLRAAVDARSPLGARLEASSLASWFSTSASSLSLAACRKHVARHTGGCNHSLVSERRD